MKPACIHKTALATEDIISLTYYYRDKAGLAVALRFIDYAEQAFRQLAERPHIGSHFGLSQPPYADIRRWHIHGFDRLIILYRPVEDGIEIIRLLDAAQDIFTLFDA